MIIWSGWGLGVAVLAILGLILAIIVGDALMSQFGMAYGPAQSAGIIVGGVLATLGMAALTRWREKGESRTFIDERTGERFEVGADAGSFFLIPTRYWSWIMLAVTAFFAYAMFDATPTSSY